MGRIICTNRVFHIPGKRTIDGVALCDDGIKRGQHGGQTLEELQAQYAPETVEEGDIDEAIAAIEANLISEPEEISRERFTAFFEGLSKKWCCHSDDESFQSEEHITGMITQICVRVNDRYFTFCDRTSLSHAAAVRKVKEFIEK